MNRRRPSVMARFTFVYDPVVGVEIPPLSVILRG
jgi:hypothetical protein